MKCFSPCSGRLLNLIVLLIIASSCTESQNHSPDEDVFDVSSFVFSGDSLDISAETDNARATTWNPDGSRIFVTGRESENVVSYDVNEPWNLTTATLHSDFSLGDDFGDSSGMSVAHGLFIRDDGDMMWVFNRTEIRAYDLSVAWDLGTASFSQYLDLSEVVQRGHDFDFKNDGTVLIIDDRNAQAVHQYELETPWDIATASHVFTLDISDVEQEVRGLEMILDGSVMLLLDTVRMEVLQYDLSSPYEISTASLSSILDVSAQSGDPRGLSISTDLSRIYITGRDNEAVYMYIRARE